MVRIDLSWNNDNTNNIIDPYNIHSYHIICTKRIRNDGI